MVKPNTGMSKAALTINIEIKALPTVRCFSWEERTRQKETIGIGIKNNPTISNSLIPRLICFILVQVIGGEGGDVRHPICQKSQKKKKEKKKKKKGKKRKKGKKKQKIVKNNAGPNVKQKKNLLNPISSKQAYN